LELGNLSEVKKEKPKMVNITINIANIYDKNIQKLIKMKVVANRSEAIRTALREYLQKEYNNLELLGFFEQDSNAQSKK
jgi:Arc/MetJ-type ribon-helix-helix transcriptional regulator